MEVTLALLADYANVTKEGKLNVMGIFTTINAPVLPCVHPQMQLVLELEAGAAERDMQKDIEVKLLDADANQIFSVKGNIKVPRGEAGRRAHIHSIMGFGNMKFNAEGDYVFAILIGGETKKEIPLRVNYVHPSPPAVQT
jgi:hypothetical protein